MGLQPKFTEIDLTFAYVVVGLGPGSMCLGLDPGCMGAHPMLGQAGSLSSQESAWSLGLWEDCLKIESVGDSLEPETTQTSSALRDQKP